MNNITKNMYKTIAIVLCLSMLFIAHPIKASAATYGNGTTVTDNSKTSASFSFTVPQSFGSGTLYVRALSSSNSGSFATFVIRRNNVQVWQDMIQMNGSDYSAVVSGWQGGTYTVTFSFPKNSANLQIAASVKN